MKFVIFLTFFLSLTLYPLYKMRRALISSHGFARSTRSPMLLSSLYFKPYEIINHEVVVYTLVLPTDSLTRRLNLHLRPGTRYDEPKSRAWWLTYFEVTGPSAIISLTAEIAGLMIKLYLLKKRLNESNVHHWHQHASGPNEARRICSELP